ncbi:MAG: 3-isopropylmalate dehydratase [Deltaproteobacteria bacterium]|nr:3-isopropylmalate dehydratase [Deltaproteobacteria bacterium]
MPKVIFKFEDDVSTDTIYPGRFMATVLPSETPRLAFADHTELNTRLNSGDLPEGSILAGGHNFGCGSSREQAVSCLKGHNLAIIAKSFARIFLQNAVNLGLKTITVPQFEAATVVNKTANREFAVSQLAPTQQAVMDAGGLIPYTRERLK